jgi:hypothetical protein
MQDVKKIVALALRIDDSHKQSAITFGGTSAFVSSWPYNPDGDPLLLVATIDFALLKGQANLGALPDSGYISIFSTYSKSDYFLENITYSGDPSELENIRAGYTVVTYSDNTTVEISPAGGIPKVLTDLVDTELAAGEFPVFSMCSTQPPTGLEVPADISADYEFGLQLYSSDFPEPYEDIFYLTDAIGHLFLRKSASGEGFFLCRAPDA